ncbi:MAG: hypothetical protein GC186_19770 [Rhodobacteraceae bacterium]|nr:hypothetical protein [Paracoccaceae bacterium]
MVDQIGQGCFTISIQCQGHLIDEAGRFHVGVATTLMQEAGIGAASTLVAADQPLQISDFYLSSYLSSFAEELKADSHVTRSRHNLMTAVVHLYGVTDIEEKLVAMGIVSVLAPGMSSEAQAKLAQVVNP